MKLPYSLPYQGNAKLSAFGTFGGLNKNLVIKSTEFSDMKNISSRFYPAIGTREQRGAVEKTLTAPRGIYHKNGLFYIDGKTAYYNGESVGTVLASEKQMVGMGAYIVIMPDMVTFNTSTREWKQMAVNFVPTTTATFAPVDENSVFTKITVTGIGSRFNQYDGVEISGCSNAEYNTTKIIQEIGTNYIVVTGKLSQQFTQSSGLVFKRNVPTMDFICESGNRLWGCSSANHEIYGSKLGDPFNWNSFESISTDSYAATVGSDGDFTGIASHMGYVLFFKENTIHKLFGNKPGNFQLNEYKVSGVRDGCSKSIDTVNETLYYVGRDGVYSYDGSTPYCISKNFGEMRLSSAVSGHQDGKLYVSANDGSKHRLFCYDPQSQIWDIEDDLRLNWTAYGDGNMYCLDSDKKIYTLTGNRSERIEWYIESGDIVEQSLSQKYVSKLLFNFWLDRGGEATVYLKVDDEPTWERNGTVSCEWNNTFQLPIIPKRCNKYRYRIEGKGHFKLLGVGKYVEQGSEVRYGIMQH